MATAGCKIWISFFCYRYKKNVDNKSCSKHKYMAINEVLIQSANDDK